MSASDEKPQKRDRRKIVKRAATGLIVAFLLSAGAAIAGVILFVQSARFAKIVKSVVAKNMPEEWGVRGDFKEFQMHFYPPGISILEPSIELRERNIVNLPSGSQIKAERIEFNFYPLQLLTGNVRVHEAVIANGQVKLALDSAFLKQKRRKRKTFTLDWEELFQIQAETVRFENTKIELNWIEGKVGGAFIANRLELAQVQEEDEVGFRANVELGELNAYYPANWTLPTKANSVKASVFIGERGVKIDEVRLVLEGLDVNIKGRIDGDLLKPQELVLDSDIQVSGLVNRFISTLDVKELDRLRDRIQGEIAFKGSLSGDLVNLQRTMVASGSLEGSGIRFKEYIFDRIESDLKWIASKGQVGELQVRNALVETVAKERIQGRPGLGGKLSFGAFDFPLDLSSPVKIPLRLDNVHLHWLAADAVKDIYPLSFRATGPIEVQISPEPKQKKWLANANVDLSVTNFILDNQKLYQPKVSPNEIFNVPEIKINGDLVFNEERFSAKGVKVNLPNTTLTANGGFHYTKGFDLVGGGLLEMSDVGKLAGSPISGKAQTKVSVKGAIENVFVLIDVDAQEAKYLNLDLDKVKGRVIWADRAKKVQFKNTSVRKSRGTIAKINGEIDFKSPGQGVIEIDAKIERGRVADLNEMFFSLTDDLWWFPHSLSGDLSATIKIAGRTTLDKLKIFSDLLIRDADYLGEKFRLVTTQFSYDGGLYALRNFVARKYNSQVVGEILFDERSRLEWNLFSKGLSFRNLDRIARLDVPIKGKIDIKSEGKRDRSGVVSASEINLTDISVRGRGYPPTRLRLASRDGQLTMDGFANGDQGEMEASYDFNIGNQSSLRVRARKLDFAPLIMIVNPDLMNDPNLRAFVSGEVNIKFRSGQIELASGTGELGQFILQKTGSRFLLTKGTYFRSEEGTFDIKGLRVSGPQGALIANVRSNRARLSGEVSGSVDYGIVEFFTPVIERSSGAANVDLTIGGSIKEPLLIGRASMQGGEIRTSAIDSPIQDIDGVIRLRQNVVTVQRLGGSLAGGTVGLNGTILLFANKFPTVDLEYSLQNNKIRIYPFQYVHVRGRGTVKGETLPYLIEGDVNLRDGIISQSFSGGTQDLRRTSRYEPKSKSLQDGNFPFFKLNVRAAGKDKLAVKNDLFDASFIGDVRVINTFANPRVTGGAKIKSGQLLFKDHRFEIASAQVDFDRPTVIDPKFNITANTEVSNTNVQIYAEGRQSEFELSFSSDPPLPENEILSLLALGFTSDELSKLGSGEETVRTGEAASLILHSFDFNRDVKKTTGFEVKIDQSVDTQTGSSIFTRQSDTGSPAPKIVIRRKLGKKFEVSAGSTVGVGGNTQREVNAEYKVTPGLSVIGVLETFEGVETPESNTSYGLDLKVEKRFK